MNRVVTERRLIQFPVPQAAGFKGGIPWRRRPAGERARPRRGRPGNPAGEPIAAIDDGW